jgi:hypothetical protein
MTNPGNHFLRDIRFLIGSQLIVLISTLQFEITSQIRHCNKKVEINERAFVTFSIVVY